MRRLVDRRGFTLIELSVVVFLIAILAMIAAPSLSSLTGVELAATARRLSQTVRYLHEEAALRGEIYALSIDLDAQRWTIAKLDDDTGEFVEDDAFLSRSVAVPRGVRITDVVLPEVGRLGNGVAPIYFYPEGLADRALVHLADGRDRAYTVAVDPVRGRADVLDGRVGDDRG